MVMDVITPAVDGVRVVKSTSMIEARADLDDIAKGVRYLTLPIEIRSETGDDSVGVKHTGVPIARTDLDNRAKRLWNVALTGTIVTPAIELALAIDRARMVTTHAHCDDALKRSRQRQFAVVVRAPALHFPVDFDRTAVREAGADVDCGSERLRYGSRVESVITEASDCTERVKDARMRVSGADLGNRVGQRRHGALLTTAIVSEARHDTVKVNAGVCGSGTDMTDPADAIGGRRRRRRLELAETTLRQGRARTVARRRWRRRFVVVDCAARQR